MENAMSLGLVLALVLLAVTAMLRRAARPAVMRVPVRVAGRARTQGRR